MRDKARIAFVKFGGLAAGGTERWLQMMAAHLSRDRFSIDYFYCDSAPYVGSDFKHPDTDPDRLRYVEEAGVNLVKFSVGAKDVRTPTHAWLDTDFWELFDPDAYDLVQTAKAGPAEYPYCRMDVPVVEYVALSAGVDRSANLAFSIHPSQWQRWQWAAAGGNLHRSDVIPVPAEPPASAENLRGELGIPADSRVAGFHQRAQDEIFSPIPLKAYKAVCRPDRCFVIMGGSRLYREQARDLQLQNVVFLEHHGAAERISQFLNTLDVFAHGRRDGETFGTVFAEAMMHGKPCLSHSSPIANAQPETMGPAGLFAADAEEYAANLQALLSDRDLSGRLARKARVHAEQYYSLHSCVKRLERVYDALLSGSSGAIERPIPYGYSDLGFLIAGELDDPSSIAHHVLTGDIPDEAVCDLLPHLLGADFSYHEVGSANTVVALAAARHAKASGTIRLHVAPGASAEAMRASIDLNNWEDRLSVDVVATPADIPTEEIRRADVVTINSSEWVARVVPQVGLHECGHRPVLLLNLAGEQVAKLTGQLEYFGYRCWLVRKHSLAPSSTLGRRSKGWLLCLHRLHHAGLIDRLPAWVRQRKLIRRKRIRDLPGKALKRVLIRGRSLAHDLRRSLPVEL